MHRALGAVVVLLCGFAVGADTIPYTVQSGPMMARAQRWFERQPVYDQDACYGPADGYARTDWNGVLGGCHLPYYRTDCSGFVSMVWGLPVSYATPRPGLEQLAQEWLALVHGEDQHLGLGTGGADLAGGVDPVQ